MKTIKLITALMLAGILAICKTASAQTGTVDRATWMLQMENEEKKIGQFVNGQIKNAAIRDSFKKLLLSSEDFKGADEARIAELLENQLRGYYREKYTRLHPEVTAIFNPGRVKIEETQGTAKPPVDASCAGGDFESGSATGFSGYAAPYAFGACNAVPPNNVAYVNVGFTNPDNFMITNNVSDPLIASLNQTHNSSVHAMRIGSPCKTGSNINMLQRSFSSAVSGPVSVKFSYALVLELATSHMNQNPFFVARVLNSSGAEVGTRICRNPEIPGFFNVLNNYSYCSRTGMLTWRNWTTDMIQFNATSGQTYTLEFFISDCGQGGHFGYGYVDDICTELPLCNLPAPENLQCKVVNTNNNALSWNPVPGAIGYKVMISEYDPACCEKSGMNPQSHIWQVSGTDTIVPGLLYPCFSWRVVAICDNGGSSTQSVVMCSCLPKPPPCSVPAPVNLKCKYLSNGNQQLSWDPAPGAFGYKLMLSEYDPACCSKSVPNPQSHVWYVSGTDTIVPGLLYSCFSWKVVSVCEDGSISNPSDVICSCTPEPCLPPADLSCRLLDSAEVYRVLSWGVVPGAASYILTMTENDPACCPGGTVAVHTQTLTANTYYQSVGMYGCFSWTVTVVCSDGSTSVPSILQCSNVCPSAGSRPGNSAASITEGQPAQIAVTAIPNPASEYIDFTVQVKDKQDAADQLTLYLFDINGREVTRKPIQHSLRLNVQPYSPGMYIYEIRSKSGIVYRGKCVIQKS